MANKHYIFGVHAVMALLQHAPQRILHLYVQDEQQQDTKRNAIVTLAKQHGIALDKVKRETLERLAPDANHQGVVAYCVQAMALAETDLLALLQTLTVPPLLLVLDGIQDPHNLGACFRSADAAGVHAIIAPKDKSVGLTSIVCKVASGATETVPFVQVTNLARVLQQLKTQGIWLYGAAGDATQTLYQTDFIGPTAIILGAEGIGLRRLTREHCDALVTIPMQGTVSSLNVSVAAGICLFEAVRQRTMNNKTK